MAMFGLVLFVAFRIGKSFLEFIDFENPSVHHKRSGSLLERRGEERRKRKFTRFADVGKSCKDMPLGSVIVYLEHGYQGLQE